MTPASVPCPLIRHAEGYYAHQVKDCHNWPVQTFLPYGYEPSYPYPLVVLFHARGGNESQVLRLAPRLSRRNYICVSLRGPQSLGFNEDGSPSCEWGNSETDNLIEDYTARAIRQIRQSYHIHTERVYLAGVGEGVVPAYQLAFRSPTQYAGVISLNGKRGDFPVSSLGRPEVRALRMFIAQGRQAPDEVVEQAKRDYRLFYSAGLSVRLRTYPSSPHVHGTMLRDVDHWIMDRIHRDEHGL